MLLKKLVFINRCYWPDSEATGQLLTELCEFLAPRWDVSAVVGQPNWETEKEAFVRSGIQIRNGVEIHRLLHSTLPKGERFARVRNLISFTLAVRKWGKSLQAGTPSPPAWADENTNPTRKRGLETFPRLRIGLVETPLINWNTRFSSGHPPAPLPEGEGSDSKGGATIICETDPFLLPLVVGPLARRTKSRVIYYLQDIYPDVAVAVGVATNNFFIRMLRSRLKQEYMRADAIVVLDEDMRDRLVGWGVPADRLKIVPNWMDCSVVKPIKSNNPFRLEHGVEDRFVVMHSGNMGMTQRLDVLVDAMRIVADGLSDSTGGESEGDQRLRRFNGDGTECRATLMIVGNGAKRAALEEQARGVANIRFLDYQPRELLSASLSAADLHVVSMDQSITGCLAPSKLYGILASGTPVLAIVPKGNAVWRLVEQEKIGWNVEPGDTAGIAQAIREAESLDRSQLQAMGNRGRVLAETLFDKRICCEAFEQVVK